MSRQFTPLPWDVFQSTDIVARGTGDFIASTNNEHNADFIVLACNSYTTIPTDRELAQAYSQGYQDGRRAQGEHAKRLREAVFIPCDTQEPTMRLNLTDADRAAIAEIGKEAGKRAENTADNLAPWTAELDALMPRGEQWVIYQTSNGLRSVVAKVNAALIAPEHGTAKEIAEGIVRDHNNALAKVAQPQPATKGE